MNGLIKITPVTIKYSKVLVLVLVGCILAIFMVWERSRMVTLCRDISQQEEELAVLRTTNVELETQIAGLASRGRIEGLAKEFRNMEFTSPENLIIVKILSDDKDKTCNYAGLGKLLKFLNRNSLPNNDNDININGEELFGNI